MSVTVLTSAWLSILAAANKEEPGSGINEVLMKHWKKYGRSFFSRYDYEECESEGAEALMKNLSETFASSGFVGSELKASTSDAKFKVAEADDFAYTDPIDGSVSKNQGLYIKFVDGSRIIFRLSGTGSSGATVRLYVEKYSKDESEYGKDAQDGLKPLIEVALAVSKLQHYTGRDKPNVITVSAITRGVNVADNAVIARARCIPFLPVDDWSDECLLFCDVSVAFEG